MFFVEMLQLFDDVAQMMSLGFEKPYRKDVFLMTRSYLSKLSVVASAESETTAPEATIEHVEEWSRFSFTSPSFNRFWLSWCITTCNHRSDAQQWSLEISCMEPSHNCSYLSCNLLDPMNVLEKLGIVVETNP